MGSGWLPRALDKPLAIVSTQGRAGAVEENRQYVGRFYAFLPERFADEPPTYSLIIKSLTSLNSGVIMWGLQTQYLGFTIPLGTCLIPSSMKRGQLLSLLLRRGGKEQILDLFTCCIISARNVLSLYQKSSLTMVSRSPNLTLSLLPLGCHSSIV